LALGGEVKIPHLISNVYSLASIYGGLAKDGVDEGRELAVLGKL
jgi:hypothetical protein